MVHTLFVWRYGGYQAILCGSFDGWTQHPMILVEGSSSIYQTICDVPPGMHQFRFFVDGVWRVDDQALHAKDEYGTINNIIIVEEPRRVEAGQEIMSIDNTAITQHAVNDGINQASSSGSIHREPVLPVVVADEIDVSRHRISMHLSTYKAYELIPNSGKVTVLDVTLPVEDAFLLMYEQELAVVPLWDGSRSQISGMLTASDFILLLKELQRDPAILNNEHPIYAWKVAKLRLSEGMLIQAGPDETLRDVADRILQNKISALPVIYLSEDSSVPQVLHIACLAGLIKHICRFFENRLQHLPFLQKPVGSLLSLGTWTGEVRAASNPTLQTLRPNDLLSTAFDLLTQVQISAVPITDDKGVLVDVLSWRHISSLAKDRVYAHIQLDRTVISQVLELVDIGTCARYYTCTPSDSLYNVMELLSNPAVRRIVVIDPGSRRVVGIITLRDVFNFILNYPR